MSMTAFPRAPFIEWVAVTRAVAGQTVCGDLALVELLAHGALIAAVDGLGHGGEATEAARIAIEVLKRNAGQSVITLVERCHTALLKTRGAVMTLASFSALEGTLSWLSVGNVGSLLLRADPGAAPPTEAALSRGGVVGYRLPALHASVVGVSPGDLLMLSSCGIGNGFDRRVM